MAYEPFTAPAPATTSGYTPYVAPVASSGYQAFGTPTATPVTPSNNLLTSTLASINASAKTFSPVSAPSPALPASLISGATNPGIPTEDDINLTHQNLAALLNQINSARNNVDVTNQSSVDGFNALVDKYTSQASDLNSKVDALSLTEKNAEAGNSIRSALASPFSPNANSTPNGVPTTPYQTPAPEFLEKQNPQNISGQTMTPAEIISGQGTFETSNLAEKNPDKIDPIAYAQQAIGQGYSPSTSGITLPPAKVGSAQWIAQKIGQALPIALLDPVASEALDAAVSQLPKGAELLSSLEGKSFFTPSQAAYSTAKQAATGALFGLIQQNKQSIAKNVLETAGAFAAFGALSNTIGAFFQPILENVGSKTFEANGLTDVTGQPVSDTLWFKNPNDENQFLKVTREGIQSEVSGPENAPVLTKIDVQAFQKNPSLASRLGNWIAGKYDEFQAIPNQQGGFVANPFGGEEPAPTEGENKTPVGSEEGIPRTDIIGQNPDLNLNRNVTVTDVHGNKATISEGEALSAYELKGGKVLLKDGREYLVSKAQYENIKNNSQVGVAKPFAPELAQTEETVKTAGAKDVGEGTADNPFRSGTPKYSNYQLPSGKNYTETLIKAPTKEVPTVKQWTVRDQFDGDIDNTFDTEEEAKAYIEQKNNPNLVIDSNMTDTSRLRYSNNVFESPHWDEPNVLAHIRTNERTYNGQPVTFLEELQSDWAREGRKQGFKIEQELKDATKNWTATKQQDSGLWKVFGDEGTQVSFDQKAPTKAEAIAQAYRSHGKIGIPNHPLLKNWQTLAIKKALLQAVKSGSKYFAWINGEQTSARYNLATHVEDVKWKTSASGLIMIDLKPKTGNPIQINVEKKTGEIVSSDKGDWNSKKIDEVLGKGLADKIMAEDTGKLSGEGLKFGGEWANTLYDKQVANIVKDLTGANPKVIDMGLPVESKQGEGWSIARESRTSTHARLSPEDLKVGLEIGKEHEKWIITDVLGDGRFKAVSKKLYDESKNGKVKSDATGYESSLDSYKETFDISTKKSPGQQAIELTPEIKAKINSEAPKLKSPSGIVPKGKVVGTAQQGDKTLNIHKGGDINPLPERGDRATQESANKEFTKVSNKEAAKEGQTPNETKLAQLLDQKSFLQEDLKNDPAKGLLKYVSKTTGQLPEVAPGKKSQFGQKGDVITQNALGAGNSYKESPDVEEAQRRVDAYKQKKANLADINQKVADARKEVMAEKAKAEQEKILSNLGPKEKHVSELLDTEAKKKVASERIKAKADFAQKTLEEAEQKKADYQIAVKKAQEIAVSKKSSFLKDTKALISPAKAIDEETQKIYKNWQADKAVSAEDAREFTQRMEPYRQVTGMQTIHDYEAGSKEPVLKEHGDEIYTRTVRAGIELGYWEDHITHLYRENPDKIKEVVATRMKDQGVSKEEINAYLKTGARLTDATALRLRVNPVFSYERSFPTYAEAQKYNLTPRYTNPVDIMAWEIKHTGEVIANRVFVDKLLDTHKLLHIQDAPTNWIPVDIPYLGKGEYSAAPELEQLLRNTFPPDLEKQPVSQRWVAKTFAQTAKIARSVENFVLYGVGLGNINFWGIAQGIKDLTTLAGSLPVDIARSVKEGDPDFSSTKTQLDLMGRFFTSNFNGNTSKLFTELQPTFREMAEQGINTNNRIGGIDSAGWKKIGQAFQEGRIKDAFGGVFAKGMEKTKDSYIPLQQAYLFKEAKERGIKMGLPESAAKEFAGHVVYNYSSALKDMGTSQTQKNIADTFFMARTTRAGALGFFFDSAKGGSTEFKNPEFYKNRMFIGGVLLSFALYNMINKKNTGHWMTENGPNDKFNMIINIPPTVGQHLPGWKPGDTFKFPLLPSLSFGIRTIFNSISDLASGDFKTARSQIVGLASEPIQVLENIFVNQNYFGDPIYKDADSATTKIAKITQYLGLTFTPSFVKEAVDYIENKTPLYQAIYRSAFLPGTFSTLSKDTQNLIYNNINAQASDKVANKIEAQKQLTKINGIASSKGGAAAQVIFDQIKKSNPALASEILSLKKTASYGNDEPLMQLQVTNGARAQTIAHIADSIPDQQERFKYLNNLMQKKIITKQVNEQLHTLLTPQGKLK